MRTVGERFLIAYSGILTAMFVISALYGFARPTQKMAINELDVQRINLREPDGTLRLIMSNSAKAPGVFIRGKEYAHPDRKAAGMIFLNDEGTENGGLIFGGEKSADGLKHSSGHLSFDAYEQDQTLSLDSSQDGTEKTTQLRIYDYPDYSIEELLKLSASVKGQPQAQQHDAFSNYFKVHGGPVPRLVIGRGLGDKEGDASVMLRLNDPAGKPRIIMMVGSDGSPSLQMLDAQGKVVGELAPKP